ncbi:MAG: glycogen synthase [Lachnospiraceae bacterium]|nr:glycogen synthase [Lachnospiraceae bacterium]
MKKILFAAAEAVPFIKIGGLADVAGSLPFAFDPKDYDVRVMLPAYTCIPETYRKSMKDLTHFQVFFHGRERYLGIREMVFRGLTFYFIDNEEYFGGPSPYTDYLYDIEKFSFFSFACLAALPHLDFQPDLIHCHDWHTGLIPPYLVTRFRFDPFFASMKTVFTIHNVKFQGLCDPEYLREISGLDDDLFRQGPLCSGSSGNMMRGALEYADAITTVSRSYAEEIRTEAYGEGLERMLSEKSDRLYGILNGIDEAFFNPQTDPALSRHYDTAHRKVGKAAAKKALQKELGLEVNPHVMLLGIVSRLTDQKGMDLVLPLLEKLTAPSFCQLVVLGTGESRYEDSFRTMASLRPDRLAVCTLYDEALSHRIYAASDAFLMPSRFEPCGLSQLIALRYGSLPIVRATGGLKDTVRSLDKEGEQATGFVFEDYDVGGLNWAFELAFRTYSEDRPLWEKMQRNAMQEDFSWTRSARSYGDLYRQVTEH